jgi:hypothetical protein
MYGSQKEKNITESTPSEGWRAGGRLFLTGLGLSGEEIAFPLDLTRRWSPDAHIGEHPRVVVRTESDVPGTKGFVLGEHDRCCLVIEPNGDSFADALDSNVMPFVLAPLAALGGLPGDLGERLLVDNKDLVRFPVSLARKVGVVIMAGVLKTEEDTEIPMPVFASGLKEFGFENEVAELSRCQPGDTAWRPYLVLVAAVPRKFQGWFTLGHAQPPGPCVGKVKFLEDVLVREIRLPLQQKPFRNIIRSLGSRSSSSEEGDNDGQHRDGPASPRSLSNHHGAHSASRFVGVQYLTSFVVGNPTYLHPHLSRLLKLHEFRAGKVIS